MVRLLSKTYEYQDDGVPVCEYAGLSTDSKPTHNIATGSTFIAVDTGDAYLFDEVAPAWHKVGGDSDG